MYYYLLYITLWIKKSIVLILCQKHQEEIVINVQKCILFENTSHLESFHVFQTYKQSIMNHESPRKQQSTDVDNTLPIGNRDI